MRNNMNRRNMMSSCRFAMSTVPGVDRDTLRAVSDMRARSAGVCEVSGITNTLLREHDAVNADFRSWTFA